MDSRERSPVLSPHADDGGQSARALYLQTKHSPRYREGNCQMDEVESAHMTTEERLITLQSEIHYHRRKAESFRKRADAQDRIADGKVKLAAELGTGDLPLLEQARVAAGVPDV
jgi:hypothetical protein